MQFLGTSNYEYSTGVPRMFDLLHSRADMGGDGDLLAHPSGPAGEHEMMGDGGTSVVHRMLWKYQGGNGFNGGPIRSALSGRLNDDQMRTFRAALLAAAPGRRRGRREFFVGRNPR